METENAVLIRSKSLFLISMEVAVCASEFRLLKYKRPGGLGCHAAPSQRRAHVRAGV